LPAATVALISALSTLGTAAGPLTWASLIVGAVLMALFIAHSVRGSGATLLDLRLFTRRPFASAAAMMFVLGVTTWGPMFLLPLYYQQLRGLSALDAGLMLAPQSAGLALALVLMGRIADRGAPHPLVLIGLSVATVGTLPFAFATAHTDALLLGASLLIRGIGFGIAGLPITVTRYKTLRPDAIPDATSTSNVVQRLGAATGTALMAVILNASTGNGTAPTARGFTTALILMVALTAVGLAAGMWLPGRETYPAPPHPPVTH